MKKENEELLFDEFPIMFRGRHKSLTESLMPFGFECGDGWFDLLYELCTNIQKANPPEEFEVVQVKEKYGTLRFYVSSFTDEIDDLISNAERKSGSICESCGGKGELRGIGWIQTLCDKCNERYEDWP
jgi:hypothetical protein